MLIALPLVAGVLALLIAFIMPEIPFLSSIIAVFGWSLYAYPIYSFFGIIAASIVDDLPLKYRYIMVLIIPLLFAYAVTEIMFQNRQLEWFIGISATAYVEVGIFFVLLWRGKKRGNIIPFQATA